MATAGIICEYNPLHNGHLFHIAQTKCALNNCDIICVMSGDYMQRGEAAIFSKYSRARVAVMCGADLVLEMPLTASLSSAEGFALGGAALLEATGVCTHLSFGSECGSTERLYAAARLLMEPETDVRLKEELKKGLSFAAARHNAIKAADASCADVISNPNDILAVEYIKALIHLDSTILPCAVRRKGDMHDKGMCSAKTLRERLLAGESIWESMPAAAAEVFKSEISAGRGPVRRADMENAMLYRLRGMTERDFEQLPGASEGLGRRYMKYAAAGSCVSEIEAAVKTKRYAMSRIRRMTMCAYLGITADSSPLPLYIRPLAMNGRGKELLASMRKSAAVPIVTKPASAKKLSEPAREAFLKASYAHDVYALAYQSVPERSGGADMKASPIIV